MEVQKKFQRMVGQLDSLIKSVSPTLPPEQVLMVGLEDMVKDDFDQLGGIPGKNGLVLTAGQPVGNGLSKEAAAELGLVEGTAVGSGVIDA
jgi:ribulose kinase